MPLCHARTMTTAEDPSTTYAKPTKAERQRFKFMLRLTNRHQLVRLTVYFVKPDDLTAFYTPGPNLFPQTLRHHNPSPPPVLSATNAGLSIPQHFTLHQTQNITCAINVILKQPRTRVDKVLWV